MMKLVQVRSTYKAVSAKPWEGKWAEDPINKNLTQVKESFDLVDQV